jgi:DNA-binding NarL/FixJ family response regulator
MLREAWTRWQQLESPYEAACTQVLLGRACREIGDRESATVHLQSAGAVFQRLGAAPDFVALEEDARSGSALPGGMLTARELEVLALVSAGETNRRIAGALGISEHTVARSAPRPIVS